MTNKVTMKVGLIDGNVSIEMKFSAKAIDGEEKEFTLAWDLEAFGQFLSDGYRTYKDIRLEMAKAYAKQIEEETQINKEELIQIKDEKDNDGQINLVN
jgi:hypothetical protein